MYNSLTVHCMLSAVMGCFLFLITEASSAQDQDQSLRELNESLVEAIRKGEYKAAATQADTLLRRAKSELGESNADYRFVALNAAESYTLAGYNEKAKAIYSHLYENWPREDPNRHMLLNNYGVFLSRIADFDRARKLLGEAIAEREKLFGDESRILGVSIESLGVVYLQLQNLQAAEQQLQKAIAIFESDESLEYANACDHLAQVYMLQNRLGEAESKFMEALRLRRKLLPPKHPLTRTTAFNFANLYFDQHNLVRAEELMLEGISKDLSDLDWDDPLLGTQLNNLSVFYAETGNTKQAAAAAKKSVELETRRFGSDHFKTGQAYFNHGSHLLDSEEYAGALESLLKANAIFEKTFNGPNRHAALTARKLGTAYRQLQRGDEAETMLLRSLKISEELGVKETPEYAITLNDLGFHYLLAGRLQLAQQKLTECALALRRSLEIRAANQTYDEQLATMAAYRPYLENLIITAFGTKEYEAAAAESIFWKGMVGIRRRRDLKASSNAASFYQDLAEIDREIENYRIANDADSPKKREIIEGLIDLRLSTTAKLRKHIEQTEVSKIPSIAEFKSRLPKSSVFIDFFSIDLGTDQKLLAAVVPESGTTSFVEFPLASEILKHLQIWERSFATSKEGWDAAIWLRETLWDSLPPITKEASLVIICPDGVLSRLPFEALPDSRGTGFLIEEHRISYAQSALMLFDQLAASDKSASPQMSFVSQIDFGEHPRGTPNWEPIDSLLASSGKIRTWFQDANPDGASFVSIEGKLANRERVERSLHESEFIHFETHGVAISIQIPVRGIDARESANLSRQSIAITRCGLMLANANVDLPDGITKEVFRDGWGKQSVLTQAKVESFNMGRCELVVLEACQTNRGRDVFGEGVIGMQRAFEVAGARSTIGSLWAVQDKPTQLLFEKFYENLWVKKMPKGESLREAKLWMIRNPDQVPTDGVLQATGRRRSFVETPKVGDQAHPLKASQKPDAKLLSPFYWAAFVLSGDWK